MDVLLLYYLFWFRVQDPSFCNEYNTNMSYNIIHSYIRQYMPIYNTMNYQKCNYSSDVTLHHAFSSAFLLAGLHWCVCMVVGSEYVSTCGIC